MPSEVRQMGTQLKRITLQNTLGSHAKEYTLWIEEMRPNRFEVLAQYGPIGGWVREESKTKGGPVSYPEAERIYERVLNEKLGKGYVQVGELRERLAQRQAAPPAQAAPRVDKKKNDDDQYRRKIEL